MAPDYGFPPARPGRGAPSMFPRKLYQILCETDPSIVGWDSDGESFHIDNMEQFVETIMPMYYRHNKLTSFQRQLNLYGFKKRTRDEKYPGHYYHPFFQRDHPEILGDVRRSYPSGSSSKSEDDEGDASPGNGAGFADSAGGLSSSPRRKRAATYPKRKAESPRPVEMRKKPPTPPLQQAANRTTEIGRHGGPYRSEFLVDGVRGDDGSVSRDDAVARSRVPAQRPWFYSGSPTVSDAAIAARPNKRPEQQRLSKADDVQQDDGDAWRGNGRGGAGGMGGGGGRAAYLRSNGKGVVVGGAGGGGGGGGSETSVRRPFPYSTMNGGRHWSYRDQEDAGSTAGAGGGWYDSEESGLSRLTSCDSACSTWDDMQQPGGLEFFDRNRARAMAASALSPGAGEDARRYRYPADGAGAGGRPLGTGPTHRAVPTSAMFPAHFLRHERFGNYQEPHYPPPPVFLPAHTNPDPDGLPPKASRWRPVYNGNRAGAGGAVGNGSSNGTGTGNASGNGGGGGGGGGGRPGGGWSGSMRPATGGRAPGEWDSRGFAEEEEMAAVAAQAEAAASAAAGGEDRSAGQRGRPQPALGGQDPSGSAAASSSSYRAACDEFLGADESGLQETDRSIGFRFDMPSARAAVGGSTAKDDSVGSRALPMTATT